MNRASTPGDRAPQTQLRGVYAITPSGWSEHRLLTACAAVLDGGAALLQLRDKPKPRPAVAQALHALCRRADVPLLINDDLDLAHALGCGVHLGGSDANIASARQQLGPSALIGASVYNSVDAAQAAAEAGASYVSFGRFYASTTKPEANAADIATLRAARATLHLPISAIGGITPANGRILADAGADLLCAVGSLFDADDPAAATRALHACVAD